MYVRMCIYACVLARGVDVYVYVFMHVYTVYTCIGTCIVSMHMVVVQFSFIPDDLLREKTISQHHRGTFAEAHYHTFAS